MQAGQLPQSAEPKKKQKGISHLLWRKVLFPDIAPGTVRVHACVCNFGFVYLLCNIGFVV